jgi:hypothetical protein
MLRPQNLIRLRQCTSAINASSTLFQRSFSIYAQVQQQKNNLKSQSTFFIPMPSSGGKPKFNESPIESAEKHDTNAPTEVSPAFRPIDYPRQSVPLTGPVSGRSVACKIGRPERAFKELKYILKVNEIQNELAKRKERLPPGEARRELRSRRHRIRFKQGIARLVGIVMRMRKKSFY